METIKYTCVLISSPCMLPLVSLKNEERKASEAKLLLVVVNAIHMHTKFHLHAHYKVLVSLSSEQKSA